MISKWKGVWAALGAIYLVTSIALMWSSIGEEPSGALTSYDFLIACCAFVAFHHSVEAIKDFINEK